MLAPSMLNDPGTPKETTPVAERMENIPQSPQNDDHDDVKYPK